MSLLFFAQAATARTFDLNGNGVFDIGDVLIIGSLVGGVVIFFQTCTTYIMRWGDRLWGKGTKAQETAHCDSTQKHADSAQKHSDSIESHEVFQELVQVLKEMRERPPTQPAACTIQHDVMKEMTRQHNSGLCELAAALREQSGVLEKSYTAILVNQEKIMGKVDRVADAVRH